MAFPRLRGRGDRPEEDLRELVRAALSGEAPIPGEHPGEYSFASYLEGRLAGAEEEAFERHVARCDRCAVELVANRRAGVGEPAARGASAWRIAASLAVVLGGLVAALLATRAVTGRLESRIAAAVAEATGNRASVEHVAFALRGGPGVEIGGVNVADPGGGPAMITAPGARWSVDIGRLVRGELRGRLRLDRPRIHVVREDGGRLNIDGVLPNSRSTDDLVARARRKAIDSVQIEGGTVVLADRGGGARRELRMTSMDASLTGISEPGPTHLVASASIDSARRNAAVVGDIGPWGDGKVPAYRFAKVGLDGVPLRSLPGVGGVLRGGLSFEGRLAGAGDTVSDVFSRMNGDGDLQVASGSIAGRNLVRDAVAPLLGDRAGSPLPPAVAALVAGQETAFDEMRGRVTVADAAISSPSLRIASNGLVAEGRASLASDGTVRFRGEMRVPPDASRELVALLPGGGALADENGNVTLPLEVAGRWPAVEVRVDVERLALRTLLRRGFARLFADLPLG